MAKEGGRPVNGIILVINAGSSSIKFALYHATGDSQLDAGSHGQFEGIGTRPHLSVYGKRDAPLLDAPYASITDHRGAIAAIRDWIRQHGAAAEVVAAGHRIVHGGERFAEPVRITPDVLTALDRLVPLAPLHEPHNLAPIRALAEATPGLPQVACFDTAFHRTQPAVARTFALPHELTDAGVRRYGFHGLSYEYIASVLPRVAPEIAGARAVVAHLGNGASMCALRAGRSVATTMGFTALDGLPMGTRPGSLDPGVLLYLMAQHHMDARSIEDLLYHRSGLLGVSGLSSDMRTLLASDSPRAKQAVDLFVYRIGRELGSLAAALGGLDALVFTGGIGENAAEIRARVCRDAAWLGLQLDEAANRAGGPRISQPAGAVSAWVVPTDENLMIAQHTRRLVSDVAE
jgi:acetate kinase